MIITTTYPSDFSSKPTERNLDLGGAYCRTILHLGWVMASIPRRACWPFEEAKKKLSTMAFFFHFISLATRQTFWSGKVEVVFICFYGHDCYNLRYFDPTSCDVNPVTALISHICYSLTSWQMFSEDPLNNNNNDMVHIWLYSHRCHWLSEVGQIRWTMIDMRWDHLMCPFLAMCINWFLCGKCQRLDGLYLRGQSMVSYVLSLHQSVWANYNDLTTTSP